MKADAVGICWYRRADYKRVLEIMADRDVLPSTFDKWQSRAEGAERALKGAGHQVYRAVIDPDHFVEWCNANGHDVDAKGRNAFASNPRNWGGLN
ncbi:hypothetical protein [Sphingomonas sp. YL-JM2C]